MKPRGAMRRRIWIIWGAFAVLVGAIVYVDHKKSVEIPREVAESIHGIEGSRLLLPVPPEGLAAVELGHRGVLHRFDRDASGAWLYHGVHQGPQANHEHQANPAQAELISKAFAALGRARMERFLELDLNAQSYGLTAPQMVILVYGKNQPLPLAQFAVGDVAPDRMSRYVLKVGGNTVVTIADYQIENLIGLLEKLQLPPSSPATKR